MTVVEWLQTIQIYCKQS